MGMGQRAGEGVGVAGVSVSVWEGVEVQVRVI